jgi:hypothetical protein
MACWKCVHQDLHIDNNIIDSFHVLMAFTGSISLRQVASAVNSQQVSAFLCQAVLQCCVVSCQRPSVSVLLL